jgi:hypothetical protein
MPTWASVTEIECSCGYLEKSASDPNTPIRYDPALNEYSIISPLGASGTDDYLSTCIYHCPFCGGAVPESKRDKLFAVVPDAEADRLHALIQGIKSLEDAKRILGIPSRDEPIQMPPGYVRPSQRDEKAVVPVRALTFTGLSEVAEIQVCVNDDNSVEVTIGPKYIGPSKGAV